MDTSPKSVVSPESRSGTPVNPRSITLSLQDVTALFHVTCQEAAASLGVGLSTLKKECRKLGITRWPYRRLKAELSILSTSKKGVDTPGRDATSTASPSSSCFGGKPRDANAGIPSTPEIGETHLRTTSLASTIPAIAVTKRGRSTSMPSTTPVTGEAKHDHNTSTPFSTWTHTLMPQQASDVATSSSSACVDGECGFGTHAQPMPHAAHDKVTPSAADSPSHERHGGVPAVGGVLCDSPSLHLPARGSRTQSVGEDDVAHKAVPATSIQNRSRTTQSNMALPADAAPRTSSVSTERVATHKRQLVGADCRPGAEQAARASAFAQRWKYHTQFVGATTACMCGYESRVHFLAECQAPMSGFSYFVP